MQNKIVVASSVGSSRYLTAVLLIRTQALVINLVFFAMATADTLCTVKNKLLERGYWTFKLSIKACQAHVLYSTPPPC